MDQTAINWDQIHNGDEEARNKMIMDNMGLVRAVARRFEGRNMDMEDLIQIGTIGLIKAIDRFETAYDVRFSTYAVPLISGEIKRFFRDDGMVKVSRTIKENSYKIARTREKLVQQMGREPTLSELSEQTGISEEDVAMAAGAGVDVISLSEPVYQRDGNEILLSDQLDSGKREEEEFLNHYLIEDGMGQLSEDERLLIRLRYFEDKTQVQVAGKLGITQVQVSRMEKKILRRMREYFQQK